MQKSFRGTPACFGGCGIADALCRRWQEDLFERPTRRQGGRPSRGPNALLSAACAKAASASWIAPSPTTSCTANAAANARPATATTARGCFLNKIRSGETKQSRWGSTRLISNFFLDYLALTTQLSANNRRIPLKTKDCWKQTTSAHLHAGQIRSSLHFRKNIRPSTYLFLNCMALFDNGCIRLTLTLVISYELIKRLTSYAFKTVQLTA